MFKSLTNFVKSENAKWIFVAAVVFIMIYSIMSYSSGKDLVRDNYDGMHSQQTAASNDQLQPANYGDAKDSVNQSMDVSDYQMAATNDPSHLLPSDENSKWGDMNPVSTSADGQAMPDLLNAVSRVGVDTIGQTMKNANLQLRSDPTIQKQNIGPWNNSTYEPDLARIPLELGCGAP